MPYPDQEFEAVRDQCEAFRAALAEIAEIAASSEFPDRHGIKHQACDTTCLNECGIVALKALGTWKSNSEAK